jgi:hypothetical protein
MLEEFRSITQIQQCASQVLLHTKGFSSNQRVDSFPVGSLFTATPAKNLASTHRVD